MRDARRGGRVGPSEYHGGTGSGRAGEVTEPLGDPARGLPGQIARFGYLVSRDLSARAFAALRARGAYDPQRHGDARNYQPLSTGEQLEMRALRAAITRDHRPAAAAGALPQSSETAGQTGGGRVAG